MSSSPAYPPGTLFLHDWIATLHTLLLLHGDLLTTIDGSPLVSALRLWQYRLHLLCEAHLLGHQMDNFRTYLLLREHYEEQLLLSTLPP